MSAPICAHCRGRIPMDPGTEGTDNGLLMLFGGGYGEFIDAAFVPADERSAYLCHECAHWLAEWLHLDVHNWHTHRIDGNQHADHHDKYENRGTLKAHREKEKSMKHYEVTIIETVTHIYSINDAETPEEAEESARFRYVEQGDDGDHPYLASEIADVRVEEVQP